ncbi:MAG TPA: hypothetical protein DEH78_00920 [Solibacterales bacterium]|nr:hypothetical protein [Bryobacterales bacterium]
MPDSHAPLHAYRFGPFRLRIEDRILERDGERVPLTPKVIDTLFVLMEARGQVVTKEALMKAVWPDVNVVESGLTRNISALRKAIEEDSGEGSCIETIPRRGYRFVAAVQEERAEAPAAVEATPPAPAPAEPAATPAGPKRWRLAAASALVAAAAGLAWFALRPPPPTPASTVEPFVKIGEHLLYKLAPDETRRAADHFERAIAANPNSANAHAGLAIALLQLTALGVYSAQETTAKASAAAERAVALGAQLGTARYALAMVRLHNDWDLAGAEAEFRRALELDRTSVQTRIGYSRLKLIQGDGAAPQRLLEEAMELDPASPAVGAAYCQVFYLRRDFRRAEAECRKVLDREPHYALAHYFLALSLGWLGRYDEAGRSLDASGLMPGVVEADRAWLLLRQGDASLARSTLENRRELIRRGSVDSTAKLLLAASLGLKDEAFEAIETGLKSRAPEVLMLHREPRLDSIRQDPRYADALRRAGLPGQ